MPQHSGDMKFSKGPVWKCIMAQAVPLTVAQLVQLLYNVVDRIYIGHMDGDNSLPLTGVGLTFPIVTLIMAFSALFGQGGAPLFSMAMGAGDNQKASRIMGNSFSLLLLSGAVLTLAGYLFCRPVLFAFGAGDASYVYAEQYLHVYLAGTVFSMVATGMNPYINAQGFPKIGMFSVLIGAISNIVLDPVFIFVLAMGVRGAALATVISQALSCGWVLLFLFGKKANLKLKFEDMKLKLSTVAGIFKLGLSNFIVHGTNCLVQVVCNSTLQSFGGDIYVGIMTVVSSVRDIFVLPINGIISGSQPVISFNYGAKNYKRVRSGILFNTLMGSGYTALAWLLVLLFPGLWFGIFSGDPAVTADGIQMLKIYFFGFVFMALQFAGQSTFQSLGDAKHAIFFSLFRKVIIVVPLTIALPYAGLGVMGVFLAEPISNIIGGTASFTTMMLTRYKEINRKSKDV